MKIAATLSFILHLFFIPLILFLFLDIGTYPTHTRTISVSLRPMEFETSAQSTFAHALENTIPIETPVLLPLAREGEELAKESEIDMAAAALAMDKNIPSEKENLPPLDGSPSKENGPPTLSFNSPEQTERIFSSYKSQEEDLGEGTGARKEGLLGGGPGQVHGEGPGIGGGGLGEGAGLGGGNFLGGTSQKGKGKGVWGRLFSSGGGGGGAIPRYAVNPKPPYPDEAREKGYEGNVLLRVEVLPNGRVGHIEVKRTSGHEILDQSALLTVRQWRFIPARKGGEAIPFWVNIPIKFYLQ
jgi:TonB family protein